MKEAIGAYRAISVSPEFREIERLRAKARHDEASALRFERNEGRNEGRTDRECEIAGSMARKGFSLEEIADITSLSIEDIKKLISDSAC